MDEYTITKQISKQGTQNIIIIPAFLRERLKPKTLVEVRIRVIDEVQDD
jgi:hypothetical protein